MSILTPSSSKILSFDERVIVNLGTGKFDVDISPTVFIGSGQSTTLGASFKVINPYGITIKDYPSGNTYDKSSSLLLSSFELSIPTELNNFQFGTYQFFAKIVDGDNKTFELVKYVTINNPSPNNSGSFFGTLKAFIHCVCNLRRVYMQVENPPPYSGVSAISTNPAYSVEYPTSSGKDVLEITSNNFFVELFDGVYKISGECFASYNLGDSVFITVKYRVFSKKEVICNVDFSCIYESMNSIYVRLSKECSRVEKDELSSLLIEAIALIELAKLAVQTGNDPSDHVYNLKKLLGVEDFNCGDLVPIIIDCGCIGVETGGTFSFYWTASDSSAFPSESEIFNLPNTDIANKGATTSVDFSIFNGAPKYLMYFEPLTEPEKHSYYFSEDDKGDIGADGPWATGVAIGTMRAYKTNYKTQTGNLPLQFKTSTV